MSIQFACPMCHRQYRLKDELAGKTAKCGCGHKMKVPQQSERATAAVPVAVQAAPSAKAKPAAAPVPAPAAAKSQPQSTMPAVATLPAVPASTSSPASTSPGSTAPSEPELEALGGLDDLGGSNLDSWLNADLESAAPASSAVVRCPSCDELMTGGAVLCTKCGYDKRTGEKRQFKSIDPDEDDGKKKPRGKFGFAASLMRGTVCCFIAAMIGAVIWAVTAYFTHKEFGFVAWALGGLTGAGMSIAHDDDDGTFAGIIAGFMSIVGIVVAKILIVTILISVVVAGALGDLPRTILAMGMVKDKLEAQGIDLENADENQVEEALKDAKKDVAKLSDAEVEARLEEMAKEAERKARESETVDEKRARLAVQVLQQKLRAQGTSIAEAPIEQLTAAKQETIKEVENLTPEQLNERLAALAEDETAGVDDEDEERVADAEFEAEEKEAEKNQPAAANAEAEDAEAAEVGAAAQVGGFAMLIGMLFTPIDGIFILLAVATAYKVGSGKLTD